MHLRKILPHCNSAEPAATTPKPKKGRADGGTPPLVEQAGLRREGILPSLAHASAPFFVVGAWRRAFRREGRQNAFPPRARPSPSPTGRHASWRGSGGGRICWASEGRHSAFPGARQCALLRCRCKDARLSARGEAECLSSKAPSFSESDRWACSLVRQRGRVNILGLRKEGGMPSLQGPVLLRVRQVGMLLWCGSGGGRTSWAFGGKAFCLPWRTLVRLCSLSVHGGAPFGAREGRMPSLQRPVLLRVRQVGMLLGAAAGAGEHAGPSEGRHSAFPGARRCALLRCRCMEARLSARGKAECLPSKGPSFQV